MFDFGVMLSVENYNAVRDERERTSQRGRWLGELRAIDARERVAAADGASGRCRVEDGRGIAAWVESAYQSMVAIVLRVRPST